ncbi:MAG: hypothetical protein KBS91_01935 [Firmicutes bacterium]|nr:hypothetical protein [Candidatus Caballimonas caccae]
MNTKGKKTIKIIVNTLLWIFLAFALAMTVFAFIANSSGKEYPVVGDKAWFCVASDSMDGKADLYKEGGRVFEYKTENNGTHIKGFKSGDLIIGETFKNDAEKRELKVGDVITFYADIDGDGENEINTHRIIEVLEDGEKYKTQGDNNAVQDGYTVMASRVEAKWTGKRIAGLGSFIDFFRSSIGFLCCIVIPLALFFIYEVIVLIITVKKMKGKKAPTLSKEDEEEIKKRAIEEYLAKQALENANKEVKEVATPKNTVKKTTSNKTVAEKKVPTKKVASKTTTATKKTATVSNEKKAPAKKVASKTTTATKKTTKTTNKK